MKVRGASAGFTLIELLVVIGLIAGLTFFLVRGMSGGKGAALQSAQASLANMITAARTKAMVSGCRVRLLIHSSPDNPSRFRRMIVLQQETALGANTWDLPQVVTFLPDDIYVLPHQNRVFVGLYETPSEWTRTGSAEALHSSALSGGVVTQAVDIATVELWEVIQFTPAGTLSYSAGSILLAVGLLRAPATYAGGESPVQMAHPESIRGIVVSTYGVPVLANNRANF